MVPYRYNSQRGEWPAGRPPLFFLPLPKESRFIITNFAFQLTTNTLMMKKSLIAASILLMASFVSFAQDSNERYYNYEILTPQRNNSRTAPKPKVEGWAAERVTEKLDRGVVAVKSAAGGSLKAQRSAALSPHFAVAREDPELSCNSPATSESANTSDIKVLTFMVFPAGINLPPSSTKFGLTH